MPTNYGSKDVGFFLVGGYSILGSQTDLTHERAAVTQKTTPIGVEFGTYDFTGLKAVALTQAGFYDAAAGGNNAALCEREGTLQVVCLGHRGNVAGRQMHAAAGAFAGTYKRGFTGDKLHAASAEYTISGEGEDPVILQALAALTTTGNTDGSSVDGGASSANGGAGYLQVTALTLGGYTSVTFKVRHSADNVTFADLLSFTVVTAAPTAERVEVAGTVNRYLSTSRTLNGAGAGPSMTALIGFARG